jgi:NADPH-dependent glutamate synthase beta subunit-like oxidoreductase
MNRQTAVIIGAGPAGLTAALELQRRTYAERGRENEGWLCGVHSTGPPRPRRGTDRGGCVSRLEREQLRHRDRSVRGGGRGQM